MPKFIKELTLLKIATPATPASGSTKLYVGTDDVPRVLTTGGVEKRIPAPSWVRQASAATSTSTTLADAGSLSFTVEASKQYIFDFRGAFTSAVSTTGLFLALNGPTLTGGSLLANMYIATSTTAVVHGSVTAYNTSVQGTGSAGTTPLPWWIEGSLIPGAAGTFTVRFATEVASSQVSINANSYGFLWQVA
jgi:hypothetical protein